MFEKVLGQEWEDARMLLFTFGGAFDSQVHLSCEQPPTGEAEARGAGEGVTRARRLWLQTSEQGRDVVILHVGGFFLAAGEDWARDSPGRGAGAALCEPKTPRRPCPSPPRSNN